MPSLNSRLALAALLVAWPNFIQAGHVFSSGLCEPITVSTCRGSGVLHRYTSTPIEVPFESAPMGHQHFMTQHEAVLELEPYMPILSKARGCREYLKPLLCAAFLPPCVGPDSHGASPPCRDLCEKAQASCRRHMRHYGLDWPPQLNCARYPPETQHGTCSSAISVGPVEELRDNDDDNAVEVRVTCSYDLSPEIRPQWSAPDGNLITDDEMERIFALKVDKHTTTLVILGYMDSVDSGNYSCRVGHSEFTRSVTITNIYEPEEAPSQSEIEIGEVNQLDILGIKLTSVVCTSTSESPSLPTWLDLYGSVIPLGFDEGDPFARFIASNVSESQVMLSIRDFDDSTDAGVYTCRGQGPDSARTVVIGNITLGPQVNLTDPSPPSQSEIEIGEVNQLDILGIKLTSVVCTSTSEPPSLPTWLDLYGSVVPLGFDEGDPFGRFIASNVSESQVMLSIRDFDDSTDAGVYTCRGQSPDSAQTVVLGDITLGPQVNLTDPSPPSQSEIEIGEVNQLDILGIKLTSVVCTSTSEPPYLPTWLDLYGSVVPLGFDEGDPFGRFIASNLSESQVILSIRDFDDSTDAGVYTCRGQGPDSAQTVVLGDITLGPQVNATEPSEEPPEEIVIGEVLTLDVFGLVYTSVSCSSNSTPPIQPVWLDIYGQVVPRGIPEINTSNRILAVNTSESVTGLIIIDFKDSTDAGVYTCRGQGPDSAQTVVLGDITLGDPSPPSQSEIEIGEVNQLDILGIKLTSVVCTSTSEPPSLPTWLDLYGSVVPLGFDEGDPFARFIASNVSESQVMLSIRDFDDSTDAGVYTCRGQGPDSARTVVIGNITRGPQVNLTDPSPPSQSEIEIGEVNQLDTLGIKLTSVVCTSTSEPPSLPTWLDQYGSVVPLGFDEGDPFGRFIASNVSESQVMLSIRDFDDSTDAGVYTCHGQGPDSAQTVVLGDITLSPQVNATEPSEQPELEIGDVETLSVGGSSFRTVACTSKSSPPIQPVWLDLYGAVVPRDILKNPFSRHFAVNSSDRETSLLIKDFEDSTDAGVYTCLGQGPDSAQTVVIGNITLGPLANPTESPCEEIRIPTCSSGIGYSSTYVPSLVGLGQDELDGVFGGLERVFDNPCSPYFRPYMCALYLPPCRERAVLPCEELCRTFVDQCAASLSSSFSAEELVGMRETCSSMPSETEPGAKCYNVKEVEISNVEHFGTRTVTAECTYNLLPSTQPRWFSPSGQEILSGFWRRVQVIEASDSVTVLQINNYMAEVDEGTYSCAGPIQRVAVDL